MNRSVMFCAFLVAACCFPLQAAEPDSSKVERAKAAIADAVADLSKDLQSSDSTRRAAAQKALQELSESVLAEVVERGGENASKQTLNLFVNVENSAAVGRMLLSLSLEDRQAVVALAKRKPAAFNDLQSRDDERVATAVGELGTEKGGEVVIRWALQNPAWQVRYAAISAAASLTKPTPQLADVLVAHMADLPEEGAQRSYSGDNDTSGYYSTLFQLTINERRKVIAALVTMKDDRALPFLIRQVVQSNNFDFYDERRNVIEMLVGLNNKRVVVTLMDYINNDQRLTEMGFNNKHIIVKRCDLAMAIIIRQTGQKTKDYGFFVPDPNMGYQNICGFESEDARRNAREKLRKWWDANQNDYEGVEKVSLVEGASPASPGRKDLPVFVQKMAH